ncbi:androgen-dependent TFPI-regulating protein isoform X2 [Camelus bactrianus]|uniref:Androgen-dependent TFPI-regulating protein isoform X2 n=1 Tax=Camelus bactrianus TaxID=9837 RepID=A0A9W3FRV2_CAMBA|nr:androgen-dependent TFPI-regulating protein isoform X2 [Camelus dromedarius]XP_045365556.1 androgen-dependent TFPI-regulating protein isoform X2 [Camelus bactrianus]
MTRTSTCIYHFLVFSWYVFLNFHISQQVGDPRKSKLFINGGQWKYLTFLNLLLQAIFYGVACLEDVLKITTGKKDIKFVTAFRDLLFTTLVFPISTFVFLSFWSLFLYDRELVYPKALDDIFPVWLNHALHTFILPFSLVEVILRPHCYPLKKKGLTLLTAAIVAYVSRRAQTPSADCLHPYATLWGPWAFTDTDGQQQVPQTVDIHGDILGKWLWVSC